MSGDRISFGDIQLNAGSSGQAEPVGPTTPFRILVLGDLTGRENCERNDPGSISNRPPITIDRDNFEDVLERSNVRLNKTLLTGEGEHVSVEFKELDDFHPDELFDKLNVFESLRKLRRQLLNNNTCDYAIEEIQSWQTGDITFDDDEDEQTPSPDTSAETPEENVPGSSGVSVDDLFDDVVSSTEAASQDVTIQWQNLVQDLVAPYGEKPVNPDRDEYVALVDQAIQRAMRALLHHPHFSDLESLWRSLYMIVRRLETSSKLVVQVCDVSKSELVADMNGNEDLSQSQLYQMLVERTVGTPGGKPWTVVVGAYSFDPTSTDISALARFASVASAANSCCTASVSGGSDQWCDSETLESSNWNLIQSTPGASHLAVAWPSFMVRLPYGKKTSSTERFGFEEFEGSIEDSELTWGNAGLLIALSLAAQYSSVKWNLDPGNVATIGDMPMLIHEVHGENEVRPAGQYPLTDKQIEVCLTAGITPLVSFKGRNEVMFQGMQSVARKPLQGAWS